MKIYINFESLGLYNNIFLLLSNFFIFFITVLHVPRTKYFIEIKRNDVCNLHTIYTCISHFRTKGILAHDMELNLQGIE